jgi:hypothetical protein
MFPNDNDPILPECYAKAYHEAAAAATHSKEVSNVWKNLTGSELKLTSRTITVTFPSEADEVFFRLRWS